jgi:hypothetical protein
MLNMKERRYLRALTAKQAEYAALPVMQDRTRNWYHHNACQQGTKPIVIIDESAFTHELYPPFQCEGEEARYLERMIVKHTIPHETIGDDRVVPGKVIIDVPLHFNYFGLDLKERLTSEGKNQDVAKPALGSILGNIVHPAETMTEALPLINPTQYSFGTDFAKRVLALAEDTFGDILPVALAMPIPHCVLVRAPFHLLGMENMLLSLIDEPDDFRVCMRRITDDCHAYLDYREKHHLYTACNGNDYVHHSTYGFTSELPDTPATAGDIWGYMNSQETSSISLQMFEEFFFPYYKEIGDRFGMLSYGCCEPVHALWESCISKLANLKKLSISPWCDEEYMGDRLRGSGIVYHRKPSPSFLGVDSSFDEEGLSKHITKTLTAAKGCTLEFAFRDVYTLKGEPDRPKRAVQIVNAMVEKHWQP